MQLYVLPVVPLIGTFSVCDARLKSTSTKQKGICVNRQVVQYTKPHYAVTQISSYIH